MAQTSQTVSVISTIPTLARLPLHLHLTISTLPSPASSSLAASPCPPAYSTLDKQAHPGPSRPLEWANSTPAASPCPPATFTQAASPCPTASTSLAASPCPPVFTLPSPHPHLHLFILASPSPPCSPPRFTPIPELPSGHYETSSDTLKNSAIHCTHHFLSPISFVTGTYHLWASMTALIFRHHLNLSETAIYFCIDAAGDFLATALVCKIWSTMRYRYKIMD